MWRPITGQDVSIHDDLFGGFIQHSGTWSSWWSKGECELEIMGYGPKPSDIQRRTWSLIQPILDELLMIAIESLPPPPRGKLLSRMFSKPVEIDRVHLMMELCDDGSHVLQFRSNLVLDGYSFNALIEMKGDRVLLAEWSC